MAKLIHVLYAASPIPCAGYQTPHMCCLAHPDIPQKGGGLACDITCLADASLLWVDTREPVAVMTAHAATCDIQHCRGARRLCGQHIPDH